MALDEAGQSPADVDVVYASANAIAGPRRRRGPRADGALRRPLADRDVASRARSAKAARSGSAACVAAVLCGAAGRVPPIAGLAAVDDEAAPLRLATASADAPGPIVLVNSFASGGALVQRRARVAITPRKAEFSLLPSAFSLDTPVSTRP